MYFRQYWGEAVFAGGMCLYHGSTYRTMCHVSDGTPQYLEGAREGQRQNVAAYTSARFCPYRAWSASCFVIDPRLWSESCHGICINPDMCTSS